MAGLSSERKIAGFIKKCVQSVEPTPADCLILKQLVLPLTAAMERGWAEVVVKLVSLRPGFEKVFSVAGHFICDFIAKKSKEEREDSADLLSDLRTLDPLSRNFNEKIQRHLRSLRIINMGNAEEACTLLSKYYMEPPDSTGRPVFPTAADRYLRDSRATRRYMVASRHMLNLPSTAAGFSSLCNDVLARLVFKYGRPSSWRGNQRWLVRMQRNSESQAHAYTAHDDMLLMINYLEFEGGEKIVPDYIDREKKNFLLDPQVLLWIERESGQRMAAVRARLPVSQKEEYAC